MRVGVITSRLDVDMDMDMDASCGGGMFVSLATTTREGERCRLDAVSGGTFECGRILAQGVLNIISRQPDLWKTGTGGGSRCIGCAGKRGEFF
jgi:hypothetical protein